ncbi:MAG: S8 family serine peptidase, partial [Gaiellaceae bacterium]
VAAGNDFDTFGRGSVGSPGSTPKAITVAAATKRREIASFSSSGPTPVSHQLKPDVTAPGAGILSSIPADKGLFSEFNGTSMAAPHVAGGAAILRQRHREWTVAQVKSALVSTGDPVVSEATGREMPTTREGGGFADLVQADEPLVFTSPTSLSFGLLARGARARRTVRLADAGGGAELWEVSLAPQTADPNVVLTVPDTAVVPGALEISVQVGAAAKQKELTGFVVLKLFDQTRRIPYWLRVAAPALGREPRGTLRKTGTYRGNTKGKPSLVRNYRYPEFGGSFAGPEQVFRVTLRRPAANFGVAVTSRGAGVAVEPRIVFAGDENHLTGYPALPLNLNPYLAGFQKRVLVSGAIRPAAGAYDVVFETRNARRAGPFTFRFWINDQTPPRVRLHSRTLLRGTPLRLTVTDSGSGVDPDSISAIVDEEFVQAAYVPETGEVELDFDQLRPGRHSLLFQVSDYQETRNMENVARILPNTRQVRAVVIVPEP